MTTMVILDIPASPDTRDAVLDALREALHDTRAFEGCEGLDLIVNQDDDTNILVYERWRSREDYERYIAFRTETGFREQFRAMFPGDPTVRVFDVDTPYP